MGLLALLDTVNTTALKSFCICGLEHLVTGVTCPVVASQNSPETPMVMWLYLKIGSLRGN